MDELSKLSISRLKEIAKAQRISLTGCSEKSDIVGALKAKGIHGDVQAKPEPKAAPAVVKPAAKVVAPKKAAGAPAKMDREAMKKKVFDIWDVDKDKFLKANEMLQIARLVGFDGSEEEWAEEFEQVCKDAREQPRWGMSEKAISRLLDDKSDKGCWLSDGDLMKVIKRADDIAKERQAMFEQKKVEAAAREKASQAAAAAAAASALAEEDQLDRALVKRKVFRLWDKDGDGVLKSEELLQLARCVGFDGPDEEFGEEYVQICEGRGCKPEDGLSEAAIVALLDDESDDGCFLSTDELAKVLTDNNIDPASPFEEKGEDSKPASLLRDEEETPDADQPDAKRPKFDRGALKNRVFLKWDEDGDGSLKQAELRMLASAMGFAGTAEEWAEQYLEMVKENGCTPEEGLTKEVFMKIVDDESSSGCFIPDEELLKVLQSGDSAHHEPAPPAEAEAPAEPAAAPAEDKAEDKKADDTPAKGAEEEVLKAAKEACAADAEVTEPPAKKANTGAPSWLDPAALKPPPAPEPEPEVEEEVVDAPTGGEKKLKKEAGAMRHSLKEKLFLLWDKDEDKMLKKDELLHLGKHLGFDGDDKAWGVEYAAMTTSRGCTPRYGLTQDAFMEFIDDESDTGCFLANEDLVKCVAAAEELASVVPLIVLGDKKGIPNKVEMMKLAKKVGWIGSKPPAGPKKAGAVISPPGANEIKWCKELKQVIEDLVGGLSEGMTEEAAITMAEKAKENLPAELFEKPPAEGEEIEEALPESKAAAGAAASAADGKVGWRQKRQQAISTGRYIGPKVVVAKAPLTPAELLAAKNSKKRKCDVCEVEPKEPATVRCVNCQAYFCAKCNEDNHPTALLKKHNRTPLVQLGEDPFTRFKDLFIQGEQWELSTSVALWRSEFGWEKVGGLNAFTAWMMPNAFFILGVGQKRLYVRGSRGGNATGYLDISAVVDKASGELMIRPIR